MTPVYISIVLNENLFRKNPIYNITNKESMSNDIENFMDEEKKNEILDEENICRICLEEGSTQNPLISVCGCQGTSKYVHEQCIVRWITRFPKNHTKYKKCEICKKNYNMTLITIPNPSLLTCKEKATLFIVINIIVFVIFFIISMSLWL